MATHHVITATLAALGATSTRPGQAPPWVVLWEQVSPGARGVLKAIGVAQGDSGHEFRIEIDGQLVVEDVFCSAHPHLNGAANNGMSLWLPFTDSIHVRVRDDGIVGDAIYWVAYELT